MSRASLGRTVTVLVAAGVAGAVCLSPLATASTPPPPTPKPTVTLPADAESLTPYLPQVSCDPVAKPGVVAFRDLMLATYKRGFDDGITRPCSEGGLSEHKEGRAWDWALSVTDPADALVATQAINWLLASGPHGEVAWNARRLGIMYIIWNGRIWGAYRTQDGWRPYSGESSHKDHVHFSFSWAGAEKHTSWWTGKVAPVDYGPCVAIEGQLAPKYTKPNPKPCPAPAKPPPPPPAKQAGPGGKGPAAYAWPGATGSHVLAVQRALRVTPRSGWYGPVTTRAVQTYQRAHRLAVTGVVDQRLAAAIHLPGAVAPPPPPKPAPPAPAYARPGDRGAHVLAVQRVLHVTPTSGWYGPVTARAVATFQRSHRLPATGVVDVATAVALRLVAPPKPLPPYALPGQRSAHVLALQRALHVRPQSGWYGPVTRAAVAAYQHSRGLPATGIADHATAHALHLV